MTTFQGTNTYLIECSRENSKINVDDDINTNGAWSNETEFGLKRGDRISVEMVCANIRGSGTGAPTIEFSGQNVVVNGEDKGYCDTKVLLEVFFTMNNNNTYSVGLPLIHPKGGINGRGFPGGTQDFDNLVMPFNLNPRIPAGTTNQINNYREINAGDGYVYPVLDSIGRVVPAVNQLTTPPQAGAPAGGAYCVYQWKTVNGGWLPPGTDLADYPTEGRLEAIRILPFASTQTTPAQPAAEIPYQATRFTDFDNGILKGRTGSHVQNNFYVGNHVWVSDEDPTAVGDYGSYWCGEIASIKGFSPLGTPAFGIGVVELYFSMSNNVPSAKYPNYGGRTGGGTGAPGLPWAGGARCACYVGDLYIDNAGNPFASFNLKAGSSQEGLINYDNLCMNETPFDSPATGATGRTFKPNGYHRGNNGHFLYARNTRVPQTGQNPDLNHFPQTEFDPTSVSGGTDPLYTATAGEYGDVPAGANFGYRNANIVEENNNNPYIFMRNDHFGAGRLGMNGEKMPKAEPMTAFIYVSINELLQDVNSLTAVINQRLQESLTGIGTTIPQTNDLLLNSLENPDGRQVASNVIPYYNRTGFYDRFVTTDSQNTLMNQSLNAQFRNEITDIIPVKNGGTVKVTPANGTSGRDMLACNYGKQYRGVPQLRLGATYADSEIPTQEELDTVKKNTYLREIETSFTHSSTTSFTLIPQPPIVTPQPDLITPQPDLVTPQPDLVTPQPDLVVPQPDLVTPQPDIYTPPVPEVPATTINYINTIDGTVSLVSDFDVANNVSPMILGNGYKVFSDDGGLSNNYSTSHSRHATFDSGADGNCIYIKINSFEFEHSSYSMYDRLGITCANTVSGLSLSSGNLSSADSDLSQYLYQSSSSSPSTFWGSSWTSSNGGYGTGGGWIFPSISSGTDSKGNTFGGAGTWYKINTRYVRFWFKSDGSATEPGWSILVGRQVNTPLIPEVPGFYTPQPDLVTPQPDLIIPQPDIITPQPDIITPQPDLVTPQPDLVTPQPPLSMPAVTDEMDLVQINGFNGWANPFYGNMATADLYKYLLGDRWAALPVHNLNNLTGDGANKFRDVGKAIIMNTQFNYQVYNFPYPAGTNDYADYLSNFPNCTPKPLNTTILYENQLIYTNIEFPTEDDEDQTWAALAKQMRKYETYYNISATAPSTYKLQVADTDNWIFDGDVGMTDDRSTAQLRTMTGQPTYHPPGVYPDTGSAPDNQAQYSDNRPAYYDWLANPEPAAAAVTATNSALGVTASNFQVTSPGRSLICPTTSHEVFAGVSATSNMDYEEKYRFMKQLGRLKLKSRFNKNFVSVMKNYKGLEIVLGDALPPEPHDADFRAANNPNDPDAKIDTTFMEALDLGFYPYFREVEEFDIASDSMKTVKKVFCALAVGTYYTDKNYAELATVNIGCLVWGNQIGISNSFYDNHAIIPMNNDQVKRDAQLTKTTVTPGRWERIAYINAVDMFAGTLPTTSGVLAYTTTSTDPPFKDNIYDFTINRQADPIYQGADGKCLYRITYEGQSVGSGIDSMQGTWKQNTNLQAAAVGGYEWISGDSYFTDTSATSPGQMPFLGLQLNAGQNTSDNPWLLATPPPNNVINASPAWSCLPCINSGGVDPNNPPSTLPYYDGHPGCKQIGYTNTTFPLFGSVEIEIWRQPTTTNVGDPIEPNLGLQQNKVNYVWTGATKPTFQYDPTKGRCEFIQLQDDNILNVKSIPYTDKSAAQTTAASVGTKAAIINSASEDAVYSRNSTVEDLANPTKSKPVRNSGVRAEISAVGIYNIFLCPENYEPPPTINLSSYWDNRVSDSGDYWKKTEENRDKIIATCIEASESNWAGSLFARLGFQSHRELLPVYGKQKNRFNPNTYNTTDPDKISRASKPLILCNAIDNSIMPALNTYFTYKDATAVADQINGVPMYSNGFLNNESVSIDVQNQALTASSPPILSTSPFLLIESDICQTNWRSGRTQQNVLFYLMKNYQASSFIYGYGSSYTHTVNQDRNLSLIHTAFRDPITGRLQKCSNNSTIIYKIERDIVVPPPQTDVMGTPLNIEAPESKEDELLQQIMKNTSKGGGNTGEGGTSGIRSGGEGGRSGGGHGVGNINRQIVDADLLQNTPAPGLGEVQAGLGTGTFIDKVQAFNTEIATALGEDPAEADIVAFVVQQIIQTYPLDLIYHEGQLQPEAFVGAPDGNGDAEVAGRMMNYVLTTIDKIGGLQKIFEFYEDPNSPGTERLNEVINRVTLNQDGELVKLDQQFGGNEAIATFQIAPEGARYLAELSSAIIKLYTNPDTGEFQTLSPEQGLSQERLQIVEQIKYIFEETLYRDGVTLTDPMGEFTGVPFRQATNLNQEVSVERSENIPSTGQGGFPNVPSFSDEKKEAPRRGRSRTRRESRFEPLDAFEKRKIRAESAEARQETKEETRKQETKEGETKEGRKSKFSPDFDTANRRSRGRRERGSTAEKRREALIRLRIRRRGGATTPAETPSGDDRRDPPQYSNTPVRMRSLTPTRPSGSGQGVRAQSTPPASRT